MSGGRSYILVTKMAQGGTNVAFLSVYLLSAGLLLSSWSNV